VSEEAAPPRWEAPGEKQLEENIVPDQITGLRGIQKTGVHTEDSC